MQKPILISVIAVVIIVIDQLTKFFAVKAGTMTLVENFLYIRLLHNSGSIFGSFKGQYLMLIWLSIFVLGVFLYFFDRIPEKGLCKYFVAIVIGGVVGNLIDRVRLGYVIDFIDFPFWYTFNVADSALTVGIIGLIILLSREK